MPRVTPPSRDPSYPEFPTIVHALAYAAAHRPDAPALTCLDRELTYAQYARAVAALAHTFAAACVAGERIAYLMRNSVDMTVALYAGMAARAEISPLNPNYTEREIEPLVRDVEPRLIVCDSEFAERARRLAKLVGDPAVIVVGPDGLSIERLLAAPAAALPLPEPGDHCAMFFTGGTTGLPKGAEHRHANLMAFCYAVVALWPLRLDAERILNVAPLFHIWGFCYTLIFPVYLRAFMDLLPAYKPAAVLEEFQKRRITTFAGGPSALYMGLRANENFAATDFASLRVCLSGGAACPVELIHFWERTTGSLLLEGWGMSEGAPIHSNPLNGVRKIGSVGIVAAGYEAEVVDLETGNRVMPTGERGEIRVRGPQFITAYRNRPDENARQIRDGWLYTGDIGYYDEDGYMFLVDRKKEMIIVGGYNVYPREIDEILFKHPAVLEAATIGVPDAFSGEAIKAYVVRKPGAELGAEALLDYCRQNLVKYKLPKHIEFIDALPRSGVGKIDKRALKARTADTPS
jgi:long-chain acyl-CoA synthetase